MAGRFGRGGIVHRQASISASARGSRAVTEPSHALAERFEHGVVCGLIRPDASYQLTGSALPSS